MYAQKINSLLNVVSSQHCFGILDEGHKKIVEYLDLSKDEIANATGLPKISIHYDERMSKELREFLKKITIVFELVMEYFKGDVRKTSLWFKINNPLLGNISPRDMIGVGRYQRLIEFVQDTLSGEAP